MNELVGKTITGRSQSIFVEEDALIISYKALFHGFKGDKRIPYSSISAMQFKEAGSWLVGYVQLTLKGAGEWHGQIVHDENAVQFEKQHAQDFEALRDFVSKKMIEPTSSIGSIADELAKLATLREQGILTEDEFAHQKSKLLG